MTNTFQKPDVRQLENENLPEEPFAAARRRDFRVSLAADVHRRIAEHAAEDVRVEICGVLVGHWGRDDDGPYVSVDEMIRSDLAAGRSGEVTFTHDAWAEISKEMDSRFPDLTIVGWYHSHPNFGIFLSQRDGFIHEHFFSGAGQIAYVVDPVRKIEGVFAWHEGKPTPCAHYWVGDEIFTRPPGEFDDPQTAGQSHRSAGPAPAGSASEPAGSLLGDLRRAALYVLVFLVGYLLASLPGAWQRERIIEGTVAHFGVWKGMRLGLREHLDAVNDDLSIMRSAAAELSAAERDLAAGKASAEETAERKKQWQNLEMQILYTGRLIDLIQERYCLDPTESAITAQMVAERLAELKAQESPKSTPSEVKSQPDSQAESRAKSPAEPRPKAKPQTPAEPFAPADAASDAPSSKATKKD